MDQLRLEMAQVLRGGSVARSTVSSLWGYHVGDKRLIDAIVTIVLSTCLNVRNI